MTQAAAGPALAGAFLLAAAVLFLLDLTLSAVLLSVGALSRVALRHLASDSGERLRFLEDMRSVRSPHRTAVQAARQACLLGGSFMAALAARAAAIPHPWIAGALCGTIVGVVLLENLAARALALRNPRAVARLSVIVVEPAYVLSYPFLAPISALMRRWPPRPEPDGEAREEESEEEVEAFIEVGEREGILEAAEGKMVRGIVDLGETRVREIMTPRTDVVALPVDSTVADARKTLMASGHSRLPVFRETIDNVVGILHLRDLVGAAGKGLDGAPVESLLRPAFFVPETQTTAELLAEMRTRTRIALVVDEYGGLAGLVTLEDVLEEIVGDIREEHEPEEPRLEQSPDGSWLVSGLAHVEEIEELFGVEVGERSFDTVGGLVVSALGRVPSPGEILDLHGLRIEILEADRRRVYRVRVRAAPTQDPAEADSP